MSENVNQPIYGYVDDNVEVPSGSNLAFGLNQSKGTLTKFEYIPNGGKDGAEQDALDIEFTIEGRDNPIRYRKFPVSQAFDKKNGNAIVTDSSHPAFKEEVANLNQVITHILGCFAPKEAIIGALSKPISSFKDFCTAAASVLPANFTEKPIDMFFQYQWNMAEGKNMTYLELPKKMNQGKFLAAGTTNKWKEVRTKDSLKYVDESNESIVHPFQRGAFFVASNWANQQKSESNDTSHETPTSSSSTPTSTGW